MALIDNLISYWKLDESSGNAEDIHSTNDLTNNNTVTYTTGKINNGADFESGSSQSLSVADNASLSITGALSISCWVNFESLPTGAIRALVSKYDSAGQQSFLFGYREDTGPTGLHVRLTDDGTTDKAYLWSWTPSLSTWYHVVMVYDPSQATATDRVITYINGSSQGVGTESWDASIYDSTASFRLGATDDGNYFDGIIDEVGIWNKVLSSTEVTSLYNSGNGLAYPLEEQQNLTLTATQASLTITDQAIGLSHTRTMLASLSSLVVTSFDATLSFFGWVKQSKSSASSWTDVSKNSASYSNISKSESSWTRQDKS